MKQQAAKSRSRISRGDMKCLRSLVRRTLVSEAEQDEGIRKLQNTLDTAVESEVIPSGVVGLGNEVSVKNLDSGEERVYTLVLPSQADIKDRMISILAPLGIALLGRSVGDVFQFDAPGGTRRFCLQGILARHEVVHSG